MRVLRQALIALAGRMRCRWAPAQAGRPSIGCRRSAVRANRAPPIAPAPDQRTVRRQECDRRGLLAVESCVDGNNGAGGVKIHRASDQTAVRTIRRRDTAGDGHKRFAIRIESMDGGQCRGGSARTAQHRVCERQDVAVRRFGANDPTTCRLHVKRARRICARRRIGRPPRWPACCRFRRSHAFRWRIVARRSSRNSSQNSGSSIRSPNCW